MSREQITGSHQGIVTTNGMFRPFAMVKGRAVATWTLTKGRVTLAPFAPITSTAARALDADADAVLAFLG